MSFLYFIWILIGQGTYSIGCIFSQTQFSNFLDTHDLKIPLSLSSRSNHMHDDHQDRLKNYFLKHVCVSTPDQMLFDKNQTPYIFLKMFLKIPLSEFALGVIYHKIVNKSFQEHVCLSVFP